MHRTPINLRTRSKNVFSQPNKSVQKEKVATNDKKLLNKTFDMNHPRSSSKQDESEDNSMNLITFLESSHKFDSTGGEMDIPNVNDYSKLSLDAKMELLLNRSSTIIKAYDCLHKTINDYQGIISKLAKENESLKKENESIKSELIQISTIFECNKKESDSKLKELSKRNEKLNQELRNDECEFWGVDEIENEDVISVVIDTAKKFDVVVNAEDISFSKRRNLSETNRMNIPRPIRVKFYNRVKRDQLVKAGRTIRIERHANIDQRNGREFIYVNEALTFNNELIYGKAREMVRKKKIQKTWCKFGKIFIQGVNTPPRVVNSVQELYEYE